LAFGGTLYLFLAVWYVLCLPFFFLPPVSRRLLQLGGRLVTPAALWVGGVRIRGEGLENLQAVEKGPYLLIANHSSNLDPMAIVTVTGRADHAYVAKADTMKRKFLGRLLKLLGWFGVDRESLLGLKRLQEEIKQRSDRGWTPHIVIFPEGTRTLTGKLGKFKLGPFLLAAQMQLPILPFVIRGTFPKHPKGAFSIYPGPVRVDIMPPIYPTPLAKPVDAVDVAAKMMAQAQAMYEAFGDLTQVVDLPEALPAKAVS
jgi:1-acyl-sn-glycerol-3-phosphate acyltransferase